MAPESRSLLLILARELASNLATPMFVVDTKGVLVFYNEAAEALLGQSFSVTGPIGLEDWGGEMFRPEDFEGRRISLEDLPLLEGMRDRKPAHTSFRITALDGVRRDIAVTSFPLFSRPDEFAGVLSVFWELQA